MLLNYATILFLIFHLEITTNDMSRLYDEGVDMRSSSIVTPSCFTFRQIHQYYFLCNWMNPV